MVSQAAKPPIEATEFVETKNISARERKSLLKAIGVMVLAFNGGEKIYIALRCFEFFNGRRDNIFTTDKFNTDFAAMNTLLVIINHYLKDLRFLVSSAIKLSGT